MAKKIRQANNSFGLRAASLAVASCLALSGVPITAHAAGLGRIVVFSALGQALRAEIEVTASREELADMKAQLASPDAFKQAGLDYATTLLSIKFSMDKRNNGQTVIKLSSDQPINDPFVDMLLELNWPTGRLVREYTFLLDPPEMAVKGTAPVTPAQTRPVAVSKTVAAASATSTVGDDVRGKAIAKVRSQEAPAKPAEQSTQAGDAREVMRGDTLRKIATETKPDGVSLEQMLVGLLRANQGAFDGGNMNRMKAGKILTVPDKSAIEAISDGDARKIIIAQSSDWNSYRSKLASVAAQTPVSDEAAKQETAGKISAKVEDKATPAAEPKDKLKVSKTDVSGDKSGAVSRQTEEELIAKEKALKEANDRLSALEKNVNDLQKLVELKNQNLAELQKQASAKETAPAEIKKQPEEIKPQVSMPAKEAVPVESASSANVEPAVPVDKPQVEVPAEPKVVEPVAKAEEVKPEKKIEDSPKPKQKAQPVVPVPPPEEPSFFDGLLENPLPLAGAGGVLALVAAYFVARRRRAGKEEVPLNLSSTLTPASSSLTGNSVFRSTGGQSVDTSHTPAQTDFSQAGPGSIDTDEVDPVAEADVYMAYGRDAQAEEILLEARQKDPKRFAVHLKLLEIYANRKDLKQFETLATDLYSETGGVGDDWEKAAAMGLRLDPGNPLFGSSANANPTAFDANETVIVSSQSMKNTVTMPGELSQLVDEGALVEQPTFEPAEVTESAPAADLASLDFDLGLGDAPVSTIAAVASIEEAMSDPLKLPEPTADEGPLDFDLASADEAVSGASAPTAGATEVLTDTSAEFDFNFEELVTRDVTTGEIKDEVNDLDFDIGFDSRTVVAQEEARSEEELKVDAYPSVTVGDDGVEFDVSLTESTFLGRSIPDASSFDLSSIDLDLNAPEIAVSDSPAVVEQEEPASVHESEFDSAQVSTAVNPDFSMEQAETIVSPTFAAEPEPDLLPEQDFSEAQTKTQLSPTLGFDVASAPVNDFAVTQEETLVNPQFGEDQDLLPEFEISANEEVATKLDLAKAYEEMGDFEGASELLQEVLKEGDAVQKEKAQAILSKIST